MSDNRFPAASGVSDAWNRMPSMGLKSSIVDGRTTFADGQSLGAPTAADEPMESPVLKVSCEASCRIP